MTTGVRQMLAEVDSMLECKFQSCLSLHFSCHCLPEISLRVISTFTRLSGSVKDMSCHSWKLYSDPKMWDFKTRALLQVRMSKDTHTAVETFLGSQAAGSGRFSSSCYHRRKASFHSPLCSFPQTATCFSQLLYNKKYLSKPTLTSCVQCQLSEQNK